MTTDALSYNEATGQSRFIRAPSPALLVAGICYILLILMGAQLLNDADTYWQITVGNWILAEQQVPRVDIFSYTMAGERWISSQWLAQVFYAATYNWLGWAGVVALAAAAIAVSFGLLSHFLFKRLPLVPALVLITAAFVLAAPHLVARPHALALPIMVAWVAGLINAVEAKRRPPFMLLPLMVVWANLHGGFTFGIFIIGAVTLEALWQASADERPRVFGQWLVFGLMALAAACITPYGPESVLVTQRILGLGPALDLIGEWQPQDFASLSGFGVCLLLGIGFAVYKGLTLPFIRILVLVGLLYMALSHVRNGELLAFLGPLFLATPLASQLGGKPQGDARSSSVATVIGVLALGLATFALAPLLAVRPAAAISPVAATEAVKATGKHNLFNSYDFGGYLVANAVKTFVDGRTELYGSDFMLRHDRAETLTDVSAFFDLMEKYDIDVTMLVPGTPAIGLLDRLDGWKRVHADEIAVVHVREGGSDGSLRN